uniref:hypothetical protein n=1 Tax=Ningiella ruwaisensis TaxID=2364274 RepID=UPI00109FA669|nr:hypothetical protein [Ningiella ruwaisensis]
MNWSDIKNTVGKIAPLVGTALGGPAGTAIGGLIAHKLGVENTPEAVALELKNNPDAAVKVRQLELEDEQHFREITFQTLDAELKDKQSAREHHKFSRMPAVICCSLTIMVLLGGYAIFATEIPEQNSTLANLLFGALLAKWGDSIAYWVGTTRSSAEKSKFKIN